MPIVEIESKLLEMPTVGPGGLVVNVPLPESFMALAERGLFVFDWQNAHRVRVDLKVGHDLVAIPARPVKFVGMPLELAGIAANPVLIKHSFAQEMVVDVESALLCLCSTKIP
jgi:hypothetical protein